MNDVGMFLRVLVMFLPLPVFWALFDQQVRMTIMNMCLLISLDLFPSMPQIVAYPEYKCLHFWFRDLDGLCKQLE